MVDFAELVSGCEMVIVFMRAYGGYKWILGTLIIIKGEIIFVCVSDL